MSLVEQQLVNQHLEFLEKKRSHLALSVVLLDQMIQTFNLATDDGSEEKIAKASEAWTRYEQHEESVVKP